VIVDEEAVRRVRDDGDADGPIPTTMAGTGNGDGVAEGVAAEGASDAAGRKGKVAHRNLFTMFVSTIAKASPSHIHSPRSWPSGVLAWHRPPS
jgi:hypothetical protein